jgi:fatty-acyl-CoA synthase
VDAAQDQVQALLERGAAAAAGARARPYRARRDFAWAVPVGVRFVESIDKTSVGKVDKKLLRAKYAAEGRPTGEVHA